MEQMPDPAPERVEVTVAINPSLLARARALDSATPFDTIANPA